MERTVEWLENGEDHSFYLIGDSDRSNYYPAIIGIAKDKSHILYSREKLIVCFKQENNWSYEEADEWVEYNVERALPYYGERAPKLSETLYVNSRNKKYFPLKIILTK